MSFTRARARAEFIGRRPALESLIKVPLYIADASSERGRELKSSGLKSRKLSSAAPGSAGTAINRISYLDVANAKFKKVSELLPGYCPEPFEVLQFHQVSATDRERNDLLAAILLSSAAFRLRETGGRSKSFARANALRYPPLLCSSLVGNSRPKRHPANCFVLKLPRHCESRSTTSREIRGERLDLLLKRH